VKSEKKLGPDRFSHFDIHWIQTDRQAKYTIIDKLVFITIVHK